MAGAVTEAFDVFDDDDHRLQTALDFGWLHGRPRARGAADYRALIGRESAAAQGFLGRTTSGTLEATALATISPAVGRDQVQLNAFFAPGSAATFGAMLDAVETWAIDHGTICLTAHVSDPDARQLEVWLDAGFVDVGERTRMTRPLQPGDRDVPAVAVEGIRILELAERPDLEEGAEKLWRASHADVPSALRFDSADLDPLRTELGLQPDDPWSRGLLVAVDADDSVVGLAVGIPRPGTTTLGHRMTATDRAWRGRGVARALKVELLRWAATNGFDELHASNDRDNVAMRRINEALGYRRQYRIVVLRRAIGG